MSRENMFVKHCMSPNVTMNVIIFIYGNLTLVLITFALTVTFSTLIPLFIHAVWRLHRKSMTMVKLNSDSWASWPGTTFALGIKSICMTHHMNNTFPIHIPRTALSRMRAIRNPGKFGFLVIIFRLLSASALRLSFNSKVLMHTYIPISSF